MTKKPKPEEALRPARPYDDVPLVGTTPPRCIRCNQVMYGNVVQSPVCPFCEHKQDVIEHEATMAEHARTMAALDTRPVTPINRSAITQADVWDTVEVGWRDDTPEVEYTPLDEGADEWVEDVDYGEDVA